MAVYVDPLIPAVKSRVWRWSHSAHLFADTLEELHAAAARIGLKKAFFQDREYFPHYDLTANKRARAIGLGVIPLSSELAIAKWRDFFVMIKNRSIK